MKEPKWISRLEVENIHKNSIEIAGGSHGLRDASLLDSAIARPKNLYAYGEQDLFHLAASYAEGISRNHAFIDGNKRTGFMAADIFLFKNGRELLPRKDDGYVAMMEALGQGKINRAEAAEYMRDNARSRMQDTTKQALRQAWKEGVTAGDRKNQPAQDRDPERER